MMSTSFSPGASSPGDPKNGVYPTPALAFVAAAVLLTLRDPPIAALVAETSRIGEGGILGAVALVKRGRPAPPPKHFRFR
jgi:hypothetical protein